MIMDPIHSHASAKLHDPAAPRALTSIQGAFEHQLSQADSRFDTTSAQRSSDRPPAEHTRGTDIEPTESRDSDAANLENVDDAERPADQNNDLDASTQQDADHDDQSDQEEDGLGDQVSDQHQQSPSNSEHASQVDQIQTLTRSFASAKPLVAATVEAADVSGHGRQPVAEQSDHQAATVGASVTATHGGEIAPVVPADEPQTNDNGQGFSQQSGSSGPSLAATLQSTEGTPQFEMPTTNAPLSASAAIGTAQPDSAAPPPPATNVLAPTQPLSGEDQANVARVVRGIVNAVNQNGGSVTLRLQPPDLGFVRVELEFTDGAVRAAFQSEQPAVRTLLIQQMSQLRQALESHGLQVDRLDVQTMQSDDNSTNTDSQSDDVADDGRSRGAFEDATQQDDALEQQSPDGSTQQDENLTFEQTLNAVA